jgi:hypothetical protein
MRALLPLEVIVSAAILLVACSSTTGPERTPDDPGVSGLTVTPSYATIDGDRVITLTAILHGSAARGAPSEVVWASSDTNVATVRAGGLVEGRKAGRVQIAATWKTARGSATVVVLNQVSKKPDPTEFPCLERQADARQLGIPGGGRC